MPELGEKLICFQCHSKFYTLEKSPLCPKCGADQRDAAKAASNERAPDEWVTAILDDVTRRDAREHYERESSKYDAYSVREGLFASIRDHVARIQGDPRCTVALDVESVGTESLYVSIKQEAQDLRRCLGVHIDHGSKMVTAEYDSGTERSMSVTVSNYRTIFSNAGGDSSFESAARYICAPLVENLARLGYLINRRHVRVIDDSD